MDSAVAFNPAGEWDRPALIGYLGTAPPYVKGMNPGREQLFSPGSWPSGHIPARIRRHSYVVKGVVTIRGEYGCNDPPTGDASRSIKLPSHLQDYGRPWLGEVTGSQVREKPHRRVVWPRHRDIAVSVLSARGNSQAALMQAYGWQLADRGNAHCLSAAGVLRAVS